MPWFATALFFLALALAAGERAIRDASFEWMLTSVAFSSGAIIAGWIFVGAIQ